MLVEGIINEELERYAEIIVRKLEDNARAQIPEASGIGNRSFRRQVIRASKDQIGAALIDFSNYLRYRDMKKPKFSKAPPIAPFVKWLREGDKYQDLQAKFIQKYGIPKSIDQMLNRMAYGITTSIYNRKTWKAKREQWYSKQVNRLIYDGLYVDLRNRLSKESLDNLKKAIAA